MTSLIKNTRGELKRLSIGLAAAKVIPNLMRPRKLLHRVLTSLAMVAGAVALIGASPSANAAPPVTSGLVLSLDASALTGLSDGQQVNTWTDTSGQNNHAIRQSGSSTGYPKYVASGLNSLPVVRFNSSTGNTGDYFSFTRITTIRSVFWVVKENSGTSDGHFLLGDNSSYDFHRKSANGFIWDSGYASGNIRGGTTKLMGTAINGTTTSLPAGSFQLISLVTTGNVNANQITQDRVYHGSWQGDIAEILIYNRALSTDEEGTVGSYLANKYQLTTTYAPLNLSINVTNPTNNQLFPSGTDVTASATVQSGTSPYTVTFYQKAGAGAFAQVGSPQTAAGPTFTQDLGTLATNTYQVYATVTDSASSPATATSTTNTFSVAAPTSTATTLATPATTTYGQTATFTATVAPTPNGGTVQFYADGTALGTPVAVNTSTGAASCSTTLLTVPTHSITAHYSGFGIYLASDAAAISQTVTKAALTVTADNKFRAPGTSNPAFTYKITGYQNGETSAVVSGAPVLSCAAAPNNSTTVGTFPITCTVGSLAASNDSFTMANGTLTVMDGAPPVVSGMSCWYDAAQGVTTSGSNVTTWNDVSGNGHHATTASGTPTLVPGDINGLPAVHLRGTNTYLNCAGGFSSIVKEQYLVVRSPNANWNGSGSFLGRASSNFLSVRASSYNMDSGTTGFWQDHFPAAVSKNGTPVAIDVPYGNGPGYRLYTITDYMILKITVDDAGVATIASYPNYQIGKNETLGTMDFDVAEIIGYDHALVSADENSITAYLTDKYFVSHVFTATVTSPADNQVLTFGTDVTAIAAAQNGKGPYTVTFYQKAGAGAFAVVGSPQTAAGPTFTQDLGTLTNGTYQVYATVTDSTSPTPVTVTSATNAFSVAPPIATATTLATSGISTFGQTATFTATVVPPPAGGTVQFYAEGDPLGTPVAVNTSTGAASYGTAILTVPTHTITAHYSGFGAYLASDAAAITQTVKQAGTAPDLTAAGVIATIDRTRTFNLGPTGMRGWLYCSWPETPGRDGITDFAPYQILVTTVGAGTPAQGILATDDVILGASAGGGAVPLFTTDARKSLGWAIGAAEAADGVLKFKCWRAGTITDVSITLPVMDAYSDTAPYNCPKTALIRGNAAANLAQRINSKGWNVDGPGSINALALLATGDATYLPMLQTYARSIAPATLNLESSGLGAWDCYKSIFLAEYYMITHDAEVFHGLSEYVIYAAKHSSMFGTAGHGFSSVPPPGGWSSGTHGSISWYGPVNQAGLVAQLSIALGKKAGVVNAEIDPAIARAANFFGYYVNRGSVPYGEHQPFWGEHQIPGQSRVYYDHSSNGKDGLAAVMFACMGDKPLQTEYFSRMSLAGYKGESYGHTGQGFSYLWTMLGANVGGPGAVAEYQKKMRWDRDMKRRLDGSFVYEGSEQFGPGQASDYWDSSYVYHDTPTAYYLLHAAIPLKKLYITGKNADPANELSTQKVSSTLAAADFSLQCGSQSKAQLLVAMGDWDPIVRYNAATELATRSLSPTDVTSLIAMAENPADANQREAACTALGCLGSTSAVPALIRRLTDANTWVRAKAAKALGQINTAAETSSVPDMLGAFVANVAPTYPFEAGFNWNDPLQISNGYLSDTLFNHLGAYTISADKALLYPAVRAGIKQPAGMWRGMLDGFVQDRLTLPDVEVLIQELLEDARTEGPCDRMFTPGPPVAAMNVLAKYQIREGLQVCADNVAYWGNIGGTALSRLTDYGEAARWTLPDLYVDLAWWAHDNNYNALTNTVAALEAATTTPTLISALPVADPQVVSTPANTPKSLTLTGSSCRTNPVAYTLATQPAHGVLTGVPPNLTYTPAAGYQGMDSFTFTVADSMTASSPATVNLVVGAGGSGLTGNYYDNMDFTSLKATRIDPSVNFDWGSTPPNTLGAGTYSVRWSGQVLAPETGIYRFSTRTSDGVRLWINGVLVINDWNDQAGNLWNDSADISMTAGQKYNLKMEYYDNSNPATARLYWYIPSRQAAMIVPQALLFPGSSVNLTSPLDGTRFGLRAGQPTSLTLTADTADVAGTVTSVSYYNGDTLIGSAATAPYSVVWTNVPAGEYRLTARSTDSTGQVTTSNVAVIGVDGYTVPVTTGLACHFDAAVGVTTNADGAVQTWNDRSGNGHHASLASGSAVLAANQLMSQPAVQLRGNSTWFNVAGGFFTKEQYLVVRSPNTTWNGSGSFLGRASNDFLSVRASSYNMASGTDVFWQDHYPAAVSRDGTPVAGNSQNGSAFHLAPITDYMLLKITVDNQASAANLAQYPYYQIGKNETLGTMDFDVAEIIGYTNALSAADEALVGGYLAAKYGIHTTYPATASLANRPATGVTTDSATLNATLIVNGSNYGVVAYWGPVNGGMNPTNWAHSAAIGSWTNTTSLDISHALTGLASSTTYYFTFCATTAANTVWAATPGALTTQASNLLSPAYRNWSADPGQGLVTGVNDGPLDDPDHDGMTNFAEFAFALNPSDGSSLNPIAQPPDRASGKFKYTRHTDTGLSYQVLTSTDMITWTPDPGATEEAVTTNGVVQTVTVHVSATPLNGKLFVRVKAE